MASWARPIASSPAASTGSPPACRLCAVPAALQSKVVVTGNPVRPNVLEAAKTPYPRFRRRNVPAARRRRLSGRARHGGHRAGGRRGAAPTRCGRNRRRATGASRRYRARRGDLCRRRGRRRDCALFRRFAGAASPAAHLVIARAGASTVSELAVIGRPAMLVPLPHALDQDQAANAAFLASGGRRRNRAPERLHAGIFDASGFADLINAPAQLAARAEAAKARRRRRRRRASRRSDHRRGAERTRAHAERS